MLMLTESEWSNNAVWDEELKWCFQLLDCSCGKMVGIKIIHAAGRPDLDNMVCRHKIADCFDSQNKSFPRFCSYLFSHNSQDALAP